MSRKKKGEQQKEKENYIIELQRIADSDPRMKKLLEELPEEEHWENLGIQNDFLFSKVMLNTELCKHLLESILDIPIKKIVVIQGQNTMDPVSESHAIRLDVYVEDEKETVYDIEMQATNTKELFRRSRYYQAIMDVNSLKSGESYQKLKKSYIIFICPFDLFEAGLPMYTCNSYCKENKDLFVDDGATRIFLNASGNLELLSNEDLKAFLSLVAGKVITGNDFVENITKIMIEAKHNLRWLGDYMTLTMEKNLIREQSLEEGMEKITALYNLLVEEGKMDDAVRIMKDKTFRNEMFQKYNI